MTGDQRGASRRPPARSSSGPRPAARRRKAKRPHWLRRILIAGIGLFVLAVAGFAIAIAMTTIPTPNELATSQATVVYYADGKNEVGRLGDSSRRSVPLAEVPELVQKAILAAEDRDFYDHGGISPIGFARAVINNLTGGSTQGGSTITQQYAKNAFLTQERSWNRKIREALLAFKLETVTSKDQILEDYLNTIYFGRHANGIDAAARAYFGKSVTDPTLSEGAVLAAVIKSPSGLAPESNKGGLRARWSYVLDGMQSQGWITADQRAGVRFPEILQAKNANRLGGQTGYLLQGIKDQLVSLGFDETEIESGGLQIVSTLDKRAEDAAVKAVEAAGPSSNTEGLRIGLASVRPNTGEIVALYGGKDFIADQINNATRPFAQAGSTFKPFALAAATEKSMPLTSVWNGDSPTTVNGYTLTNYGDRSFGEISLLKATLRSVNSAYVQMESAIGVDAVSNAAVRAGIPESTPGLNLDKLDLTFVLGTASPSGLSMANAYATFAAQGVRSTTSIVDKVIGPNGGLLYDYEPTLTTEFDSRVADTVTYALNENVLRGTAFAAQALNRPASAKTGTTDGNKSAWFVGYTPQLSTAVLMAKENASGLPVSLSGTGGLRTVTGGSFPAAIWTKYMKAALKGQPVVPLPEPPSSINDRLDCVALTDANGGLPPLGCANADANEFSPEPIGEAPNGDVFGNPSTTVAPVPLGDAAPKQVPTTRPSRSPSKTPSKAPVKGDGDGPPSVAG